MKNDEIKEFLTDLAQEKGFKDEFLKLKEKVEKKGFSKKDNEKFISECLLPWSKKLGYKLTKKDFINFDRTQKPTENTGLSPVELENVSGGAWPMFLAIFAMIGGAFAGGASGGTTGNNAKNNNNFDSTDLTSFYSSGATSSSEGGALSQPEVTLNMLKEGHKIGNVILDEYKQPDVTTPASDKSMSTAPEPKPAGDAFVEDPVLLANNKVVLLKGLKSLTVNIGAIATGVKPDLYQKIRELEGKINEAENIDTLEEIEAEMTALKDVIQLPGKIEQLESLSKSRGVKYSREGNLYDPFSELKEKLNNATMIDDLTDMKSDVNSLEKAIQSSGNGPNIYADLARFTIGSGVGFATIVGVTSALASGSSGGTAQQNNTDKTKETTAKTEDKKSTREAKKDGNDFMRSFMETLQKNSPEASQYLDSLKSKEK